MSSAMAASQANTLWTVALGVGLVVVLVVVVLIMLLLSFLKDIEESAVKLLEASDQLASNTSAIAGLADTGPVLKQVEEEALIHDAYLTRATSS